MACIESGEVGWDERSPEKQCCTDADEDVARFVEVFRQFARLKGQESTGNHKEEVVSEGEEYCG